MTDKMATKKRQHHRHHHHAAFIPDLDLMNSLMLLWLAIVMTALFLNSANKFFHGHELFPSFSFSFAPTSDTSDAQWKHLEAHGDAELMYKTIIPTRLHAHRAVTTADLPIEALLHVFRDTPNSVSLRMMH